MSERVFCLELKCYTGARMQQPSFVACQARAKQFIRDRVRFYNTYYDFSYRRISVKRMKTRWGSCSSKGNLNFNYHLYVLPIELVDYVVVHEMCHLAEQNHSKRFWSLVHRTIPDHKERRRQLRSYPQEL